MDQTKKIVHIVGTGTIGEPLIGLFVRKQKELGIDEVTFHKQTPTPLDRPKIENLVKRGAKLCVDKDHWGQFENIGYKPAYTRREALERASVVVDCTPSGVGQQNKTDFYNSYKNNTLGFMAQGSEFGFGKMYARGINDEAFNPQKDKFLQIVSCNTHSLAILTKTLGVDAKNKVSNIENAQFVLMRRANDVSQTKDFLPAPQLGKHSDKSFGTHHARDLHHLFKTLSVDLNVYSSSVKIPTQYMHTLWFNVKLKKPMTLEEVKNRFIENPLVAITNRQTVNEVFSFGRDHGYYGRILNQVVVSMPTVEVLQGGKEVVGFCMTPQDGNSLLSTVAATLKYLYREEWEEKLKLFDPYIFKEI
ncbi:MAG: hypothetical protein HYW47_06955 [Deltaproteobacteria bacterium]|nr:hypothetical protein [Deltaproteobacteria bacterium]